MPSKVPGRTRPDLRKDQAFMIDSKAVDWIISQANLKKTDTVLEIGAGTGNLTRALAASGARVIAVGDLDRPGAAAEALRGCTVNAARAICRDDTVGSIAPGKQADLVVWNIPNYKHLGYHSGVNLVRFVIKKGNIVARNVNTVKGT